MDAPRVTPVAVRALVCTQLLVVVLSFGEGIEMHAPVTASDAEHACRTAECSRGRL